MGVRCIGLPLSLPPFFYLYCYASKRPPRRDGEGFTFSLLDGGTFIPDGRNSSGFLIRFESRPLVAGYEEDSIVSVFVCPSLLLSEKGRLALVAGVSRTTPCRLQFQTLSIWLPLHALFGAVFLVGFLLRLSFGGVEEGEKADGV